MRYINALYELLLEPRMSDEDLQRKEHVLNLILTGMLVLLFLLTPSAFVSHSHHVGTYARIPIPTLGVGLLLFGGLLVLSRKGWLNLVSWVFIVLYFLFTIYAIWKYSFTLPMIILGSILIIVISSILINIRFGFFATAVLCACVAGITILQVHHLIPPDRYKHHDGVSIQDVIDTSIIFFLIAGASWFSNREIERSLDRAKKSEAALIEERNSLEVKVEERTRELKSLQADKIVQLYRDAELGKLSAGIFHDLMNPLNAVIANVSRLQSHPENIEDVRSHLEKAVGASRRMGDFLASIRRQIHTTDMKEVFSAGKELAEAADLMRYRSHEAMVTLSFSVVDNVAIFGNPLKFHQVAINLISNAIDACEEARFERGGLSEHESTIVISLRKDFEKMELSVADHGIGIPESIQEAIFETFFTTKDRSKGSGLGLSTTKQIVENEFGGTISFTSTEHYGTTFRVVIPLSR